MPGEITPRLFRFFSELARHNDRAWFEDNKARYVEEVRDPLLRFVEKFGPRLARISLHMTADPRPVGGSLFRIHRDTRFARDKSPYKTHAGLSFRHAAGRDVHAHLLPPPAARHGVRGRGHVAAASGGGQAGARRHGGEA
jgi:uncharacterized protein (TIGR02453 family)